MTTIEEFVDDIFEGDLRNLANGVISDTHVKVEESLLVREKMLKKMDNFPVKDYVFKKFDKPVQMHCLSEMQIGNETTRIDPMLLFQRLVLITTQSDGKSKTFSNMNFQHFQLLCLMIHA